MNLTKEQIERLIELMERGEILEKFVEQTSGDINARAAARFFGPQYTKMKEELGETKF